MKGENPAAKKKELRRALLFRRRSLAEKERAEYSRAVTKKLLADERVKRAKNIFAYAAMADEVATGELLEALLAAKKNVYLPLVIGDGEMEAVRLFAMDDLVPDKYGILTVKEAGAGGRREYARPEEIDCAIVPGAAFSPDGTRLGMGGGFYDRFLIKAKKAYRLAAAFSCQILPVGEIPTETFDEKVETIFTEKEIIDCK